MANNEMNYFQILCQFDASHNQDMDKLTIYFENGGIVKAKHIIISHHSMEWSAH